MVKTMTTTNSLPLPLQWTQHVRDVYITATVFEPTEVSIVSTSNSLEMSCTSEGKQYSVSLQLYGGVQDDSVKHIVSSRSIRLRLAKVREGSARPPFWPRLTKDKVKLAHVTVDWNTWKDEDDLLDEEDDAAQSQAFSEAMGFRMSNGTTLSGGGDPAVIAEMQRAHLAAAQCNSQS